jgi:hypothetical protein
MAQVDESSGYRIILHVPCQPSSLALPCLGPSQFCTIVQVCMAPVQCLVPSGNAGCLEASVLEALARRLALEASAAARGGVARCLEAPRRPWLGAWRARLEAPERRRFLEPSRAASRIGVASGLAARPRMAARARVSRPCRFRMQSPCHYVGMILAG